MRAVATVAVAALLVVAGCVSPIAPGDDGSTATPEPTTEAPETANETDDTDSGQADAPPPDPETDRIGWEDGYWYNESIDVDNTDGLTDEEFEEVLARTKARVEYIRGQEFTEDVEVRQFDVDQSPDVIRPRENESFLTFENVRYEALFQVGDQANGREVFWEGFGNRGAFYDYWNHSAVLKISDEENPSVYPQQFSHELAHALQDQHYNLTEFIGQPTMDGSYARRGVVEGGAKIVDRRYVQRCQSAQWECLETPERSPGVGGTEHWGLYGLQLVWYEHGMAMMYMDYLDDGWEAVDRLYENPPTSTEQVVAPSTYPDDDPVEVDLSDATSNGWERVRPDRGFPYQERPAYARNGQAAIATMFIQTDVSWLAEDTYDSYNDSSVISLNETADADLQFAGSPLRRHLSYNFSYADGWEGDRLHVYQNGNETGYVWHIVWDSSEEAGEFHDGYRKLLQHWGGTEIEDGVWHIEEESPYADAIRVDVDGDTVTIVNAPTVEDLEDVRDASG